MRGFGTGIYSISFDLGFLIGPIILGIYIELAGSYTSILWLLPIFPAASLITIQIINIAMKLK